MWNSEQGGREGWGDGLGGQGVCRDGRTKPPAHRPQGPRGLSQSLQRLRHLPGTIFIRDSGGSPRGRRGEGAVQRVTDPSEAAVSRAVAVAVGGGHGWRSRCQQQCVCPWGRGGVGRGWGGDINI